MQKPTIQIAWANRDNLISLERKLEEKFRYLTNDPEANEYEKFIWNILYISLQSKLHEPMSENGPKREYIKIIVEYVIIIWIY